MERLLDWMDRNWAKTLGLALVLVTVLFAATMCSIADAATATVTWTNPATNTDGSAIPAAPGAGSLTSTRIEYGSCSAANVFGAKAGEVTVAQPATTATLTGLAPATAYCFRAFAKNSYNSESAASNVVSKATPATTPNAPVLSSTITVAYDLRGIRRDGTVLLGRAVGQIELGTPCLDYSYRTNRGTYHGVDRDRVRLVREPRSAMVVTRCAEHG